MNIMLVNLARMVADSGGLAKVTCSFANEMVRRGHSVSLLFCDTKQGVFFYPMLPQVRIYNLCHHNGRDVAYPKSMKLCREVLRLFSKRNSREINDQFFRKYFTEDMRAIIEAEHPDIVIASQPAASRMLLSELRIAVPVILMSHGDPEDYFHTYPQGEIPSVGMSCACQVLLPSFAESIKKRFPLQRVEVIGNVVPQYDKCVDLSVKKEIYKIIFIGRLVKNHKRPHLLIEAFANLAARYPQWRLELWGAESNRAYTNTLRRMIAKRGLTGQVSLCGVSHDVSQVLIDGDIIVLPSAYEGFGLTLAEGMSMGLPGIGYQSCSAVNELIKDGRNGILCKDGAGPLGEALERMMVDQALRCRMGVAAHHDMKEYSADIVWEKWEQLIAECAGE